MEPTAPPTPATPTPARRTARIALVALAAALVLAAPFVSSAGDDAVVGAVFDADGMGFNATSTKDISNIRVEDCEGQIHLHDDLEGNSYVHREDFVIAAVYIKSGDNGVRGVGERVANDGACDEETSSSSSTTTSDETSTTSDETSTTSDETSTTDAETTTSDSSTTDDSSTEIPFFTSGTALVLGMGGALAGTMVMLRRRL